MENRLIFTVSELTRHIKESLEPLYADILVEGEISNLRIPASGHCYLTLKDSGSQIRAARRVPSASAIQVFSISRTARGYVCAVLMSHLPRG